MNIVSQSGPRTPKTRADWLSVDDLRERLYGPLVRALGTSANIGEVSLLCEAKAVADDCMKLLVRDRHRRPVMVVLCSSPVSPQLVRRGMQRAREAKRALGPALGHVILDPLAEGDIAGCSYSILPYCRPLSNKRLIRRIQRRMMRPVVLRWLRLATSATVTNVAASHLQRAFMIPLAHLADLRAVPDHLRHGASAALRALDHGIWTPCYVLMHGDLWDGNILIHHADPTGFGRPWGARFVLIDWPGALLNGYAIYDLLRFAQAMSLQGRQLRRELEIHCRVLDCRFEHARFHLLTSLGYLAMHLEHFPPARYAKMSASCVRVLETIGG